VVGASAQWVALRKHKHMGFKIREKLLPVFSKLFKEWKKFLKYLPSKCKVLSSNLSSAKKKKKCFPEAGKR
jgi:hypothetical protein